MECRLGKDGRRGGRAVQEGDASFRFSRLICLFLHNLSLICFLALCISSFTGRTGERVGLGWERMCVARLRPDLLLVAWPRGNKYYIDCSHRSHNLSGQRRGRRIEMTISANCFIITDHEY